MSNGPASPHDQVDPIDQKHVRGRFATRIGFLLAAVGSAVGLGNIWKFPYIMGEYGGAAFILVYLLCITFVGLPVLITEFVIGRKGQTSAISSYRRIAPGKIWWLNGLMGVVTAFIILAFYSAVAGWVLQYFVAGVTEGYGSYTQVQLAHDDILFQKNPMLPGNQVVSLAVLAPEEEQELSINIEEKEVADSDSATTITVVVAHDGETPLTSKADLARAVNEHPEASRYITATFAEETANELAGELSPTPLAPAAGAKFGELISSWRQPLIYQFIAMLLTAIVIYFGIEKGIERTAKWMMPLLLLLLVLLVLRSLTLPNAWRGVEFMLKPDFTKLTWKSVLVALGHSFFTLSVGMGVMITYASYVGREVHLGKMGVQVAVLDTTIAILAGLVIFPAVFSFGMNPGGGPSLLFITLPQVFAQMPLGRVAGSAFFFLVFIAALTSCISIIEPVVTWLVDDCKLKRHLATALAAFAIFLVGIPACLSVTPEGLLGDFTLPFIGGKEQFFDWLDKLSSLILLPLGGLVACLFLVWGWKRREEIMDEMSGTAGRWDHWGVRLWFFLVITVAPAGILAVLVFGILEQAGFKF